MTLIVFMDVDFFMRKQLFFFEAFFFFFFFFFFPYMHYYVQRTSNSTLVLTTVELVSTFEHTRLGRGDIGFFFFLFFIPVNGNGYQVPFCKGTAIGSKAEFCLVYMAGMNLVLTWV